MRRRLGPKRAEGSREGLTRSQAEAEIRRLIAATVAALGDPYISRIKARRPQALAIVSVESMLSIWLVPFFAERDPGKIRVEDVRYLLRMMEAGDRPGPRRKGRPSLRKPLSRRLIEHRIHLLAAMLSLAERQGCVTGNVAKRVDLPRRAPQVEEIRFLEAVEVDAVARCAIGGPYQQIDRALFTTAAMTGLRAGELVALRSRDIDWKAHRIRVRHSYILGEFGTPKSRRSTRSVPMVDQVGGELQRLYLAAGEPSDDALVFADPPTNVPLKRRRSSGGSERR